MLQRILAPFREFGVMGGFLYLVDRFLRRLSPGIGLYVYEFMAQPILRTPMLPAQLFKHLKYIEIDSTHRDLVEMHARPEIIVARFQQGAKCLGVYLRDRLVGYVWFCFNAYEEDEVRCTYVLKEPRRSVFDFDFYVLPNYRMGIGFMAVWHAANEYLSSMNIDFTFSRLTRFNVASKKAHEHLGWKRLGQAIFLKVGKFEAMVSTLFPFVSMSISRDKRVRLELAPAAGASNQRHS